MYDSFKGKMDKVPAVDLRPKFPLSPPKYLCSEDIVLYSLPNELMY